MTRYEKIMSKLDFILAAAGRTTDAMQKIWQDKAESLKTMLNGLTVEEAQEVVNG